MKKKVLALIAVAILALATITPVVASQPPGLLGHEGNGQPGNQGGPQHHP